MLPFSIGFAELVVIFTVLLLVVGPKGIPQLARTIGGWVRMARRTMRELQDVVLDADLKEPLVKPWEEVVKARDQAIESVLAIGDDVLEAEVKEEETESPDPATDVSPTTSGESTAPQRVQPRTSAVPASNSSNVMSSIDSSAQTSEAEDG